MNPYEMNELIMQKWARQEKLIDRKKKLEKIENELRMNKISLTLRSVYYFIKRFILIVLGLVFLGAAILFIAMPEKILKFDDKVYKSVINAFSEVFYNRTQESFELSLETLVKKGDVTNIQNWIQVFSDSVKIFIEKEVVFYVVLFGILMLILAFFVFYTARLTRQLRIRNASIAMADEMTQELIKEFQQTIMEEEKEIIFLKNFLNNNKI